MKCMQDIYDQFPNKSAFQHAVFSAHFQPFTPINQCTFGSEDHLLYCMANGEAYSMRPTNGGLVVWQGPARAKHKVEFILVEDSNTWRTVVIDVPLWEVGSFYGEDNWVDACNVWAREKLLPQPEYRKVVFLSVFNEDYRED